MAAPTTENLGARTLTGALWLASQTVFSRFIGLLSQLALGWLLDPKDFGQIGLVYTITSFAAQLTDPGVDDVLLQKQKRLRRWMTAAFWMSLTCGIAGAIAMSLIGAAVVWVARHLGNAAFGNPSIIWMILILAVSSPLAALTVVPATVLRSELHFARVASINLAEVVTRQGLTIAFAAMGFGAYSFVIPVPIVAGLKAMTLWLMVRPPVRANLSVHRWPALISSTGWVFGVRYLSALTSQGDYLVLGVLLADYALVGQYFFAFMLSTQIIRLVSDNVAAVLTPALNAIRENERRMHQAVERSSNLLAATIIPLATLQILLAGPVIRLLFAHKWEVAIPLVQWLSVGPILYGACWPMGSMILVSGRFRAAFFLWVFYAVAFFALVTPSTWYGQAVGTSIAVALWSWIVSVGHSACAFRSGRGVLVLFRAVRYPLLSAGAGGACGALLVSLMPAGPVFDVATIVLGAPAVLAIYLASLKYLEPQVIEGFVQQLRIQLRTHGRSSAASSPVGSQIAAEAAVDGLVRTKGASG
jgi:O-antigen/teichoic acid export membrane protein